MMNFTSFPRFVSNSSNLLSKIFLTRNISTVVVYRENNLTGNHYPQALFRFSAVLNSDTKCKFSKYSSAASRADDEKKLPLLQLKKRPIRKKRFISEDQDLLQPGFWNVKALATAEDYHLESLMDGLLKQDLYVPKQINASSKYKIEVMFDEHEFDRDIKETHSFPNDF